MYFLSDLRWAHVFLIVVFFNFKNKGFLKNLFFKMETKDLLMYFWFHDRSPGKCLHEAYDYVSENPSLWELGLRNFWESRSFVPYENS